MHKKRPMLRKRVKQKEKYHVGYERERKYNFLKYWRIVRYYVKRKYELSESDLEMLLFLYDEGRFDSAGFKEFANILEWDRDRFWKLRKAEYIVVWRKKNEVSNRKAIYELSAKSKRIVNHVYKRLLMKETFSENPRINPIMKGDTYTDRVYRMAIKKMNAKIRGKQSSEEASDL